MHASVFPLEETDQCLRKDKARLTSKTLVQELSKIVDATNGMEVSFNAIPALTGSRVLLKIANSEGLAMEAQQAKMIVEYSNGDLLNAIETLQLFAQGKLDKGMATEAKKRGKKVISLCGQCLAYIML